MTATLQRWNQRHPLGYQASAVASLVVATFGVLGVACWGMSGS